MTFPLRSAVLCLAGLLLLGACGPSSPADDEAVRNSADKTVVADIMATAQSDFKTGDSITSDFEFIKAFTGPIPDEVQQFGAAELIVLLVAVNIDDPNIEDGFQGAQGPVYVVLDAQGEPLVPLGTNSQPFFDIEPPDDPGWTRWADSLEGTDVALDLFTGVNPNR